MKKEEIKAVIFDIGGVLALGPPLVKIKNKLHRLGVHEYVARKLKVSLDQYFDAIDTTYAKSIVGQLPRNSIIRTISKNLKTTSNILNKLYTKAYIKNFKQNKQLFKQALKLKRQGYKIAILSDQWHLSKVALISRRYYKKFNPVIISCDVGMRKPDTKIYKLTLKKLNLKPKECLFIDDHHWNIKAAKKLGMKTILFRNNKQLFKQNRWKNLFEKKCQLK